MPTFRSTLWVYVVAPTLFLGTGCGENNENKINTKGTVTAPEALSPPDTKGEPAKPATPPSYPGAGRRR